MSANQGHYSIDEPSLLSPDEKLFEAARNGNLNDFIKLCDEEHLNPLTLRNKPGLNFLIHEAASESQVNIIEEILKRDQRNETLESKNLYGQTPLHVAAMYNRYETIEFLIDKGANPNSKDKNECTALHLSIEMGKKSSWRMLLEKDGVDFHTENKNGNTLLHTAAENGSTDLCKELVEKKVNIKKLNKDKEHALFGVLRKLKGQNTIRMLRYLFDECIDQQERENILTKENAKGETLLNVAQQYGNKEVIKYLKQLLAEIDNSVLFVDGNKKLNQVKLFVCGSENVGKTTLIESLKSKDRWPFRIHNSKSDRNPTLGIDIKMCNFPDAGVFSVWDFGGQPEFYLTHPLFLDVHNAITLLVYTTVTAEQQQTTSITSKIMEWLRFLKASIDETKPSEKKPTVILVGTHSDEVDRQGAVSKGKFAVKYLKEKFSKWLNILDEVIVVDARQAYVSETQGMNLLRQTLQKQRNSLLATIPMRCSEILDYLAKCNNAFPVKTWSEYLQFVRNEVIPDIDEGLLQKATAYLQNIGEICVLKIPQIEAAASDDSSSPSVELDALKQSRIVLRPQWLCKDIFGKLLAPECFSDKLVNVNPKKHTYSKDEMRKTFNYVPDVDELIHLLLILELCYKMTHGQEQDMEVVIPCKLVTDMPSDVWKVNATTVSYGRRICCKNEDIDGFQKGFFPKIQTSLAIYVRETGGDLVLWKNGLKGSLDGVDFIIQMTSELQAVQIVVKTSLDDTYCHIRKMPHQMCLKKCHHVLLRLTQHVDYIKDETCPGTETMVRFLSSKSLKECGDPSTITHTYSIEELLEAEERKQGLVSTYDKQDYVDQILIPGSSTEVLEKLHEESNVKWIPTEILAEVAAKLDVTDTDMHDYRAFSAVIDLEQKCKSLVGHCESITIALLNEWCEKEGATIQYMIEILEKKPILEGLWKDRGDVARELKKIFPIASVPQTRHINMSE